MKNNREFLIVLIAIGVVLGVGYKGFGWENTFNNFIKLDTSGESSAVGDPVREEAWSIFTQYIEFAQAHDIENVKLLSHQVSPTCSTPARLEECNAIMDSVALIGSYLEKDVFDRAVYDDKQVILYTGGPNRGFLYFTRDGAGTLKVLGMRFCQDDPNTGFLCPDANASTQDTDGDLWWDSVESLFYENQ